MMTKTMTSTVTLGGPQILEITRWNGLQVHSYLQHSNLILLLVVEVSVMCLLGLEEMDYKTMTIPIMMGMPMLVRLSRWVRLQMVVLNRIIQNLEQIFLLLHIQTEGHLGFILLIFLEVEVTIVLEI